MILDEPTNHLDLPARESLENALKEFDGTVLFVSHDRYFIRALAGKILELENGNATLYAGNYDEYTALKNLQKQETQRIPAPTLSDNQPSVSAEKTGFYRNKEERAAEAKRRTRVKKIEDEISALEQEESQINEELSTPQVTGNFTLLTEKCNRLEEIKNKLELLYAEYETLL